MKMSNTEVVANVTLSVEEIADGRPRANLFGHEVRRPDIREKIIPFASAHPVPCVFLTMNWM